MISKVVVNQCYFWNISNEVLGTRIAPRLADGRFASTVVIVFWNFKLQLMIVLCQDFE